MKRGVTITAATLAASVLLTLLFSWHERQTSTSPADEMGLSRERWLDGRLFPFSMRPTERDRLPGRAVKTGNSGSINPSSCVAYCPRPVCVHYRRADHGCCGPEMQSILAVVQDATLAIDGILKDRHYQIHTHGPSIWLTAEDRSRSTTGESSRMAQIVWSDRWKPWSLRMRRCWREMMCAALKRSSTLMEPCASFGGKTSMRFSGITRTNRVSNMQEGLRDRHGSIYAVTILGMCYRAMCMTGQCGVEL